MSPSAQLAMIKKQCGQPSVTDRIFRSMSRPACRLNGRAAAELAAVPYFCDLSAKQTTVNSLALGSSNDYSHGAQCSPTTRIIVIVVWMDKRQTRFLAIGRPPKRVCVFVRRVITLSAAGNSIDRGLDLFGSRAAIESVSWLIGVAAHANPNAMGKHKKVALSSDESTSDDASVRCFVRARI